MLYLSGYDLDILNESGTSIFYGNKVEFSSLTIIEKLWNVAYFELEVITENHDIFKSFKNLTLNYTSKTCKRSFSSALGINSVLIAKNIITFKGYMTKWENFKTTSTKYLADNLTDAILATGVKKSIRAKTDSNSFQIAGDLYQVNTTNLQQCLDLCCIASNDSCWTIGADQVRINAQPNDFEIPYSYYIEKYPTLTDQTETTSETSPNEMYACGSFRDISCVWDFQYDNHFKSYLKNKKREKLGFSSYLVFSESGEFEASVTDSKTNHLQTYANIKTWVVVSLILSITKGEIESKVVLGGLE